ncbi:unnamed protein product [Microthlaspi erraticum]|uniref:RING-type E3 ubiquitin transferase n=1 Tax=Microthlaspi erraticum TaxID=1685480 RepID=A0A6D2JEA9_9BRAS|nr:unnamed protein product [Microthlaspi erraticum]
MARHSSDDGHPPVNSTVVAIDKDKNSHYAVRWAVDHLFNLINNPNMILVHVRLKNSYHSGNDNDDLNQLFVPYRGYCARKGITMMEVVLEDTDVAKAVLDYVNNNLVNNIVVGSSSSKNPFARSLKLTKSHDVPASILKSTPEFCSIYVISKGKVQSSRTAQRTITNTLVPPRAPSSTFHHLNVPDNDQDPVPRSQRSSRNSTPERYPNHDNGFKAGRERLRSPTNGSMNFHHDFQPAKGQRNSGGHSSVSDESDGGSLMMGSIDITARNFWYHGRWICFF